MKLFSKNVLFITLISLVLVSCGDDDDGKITVNPDVINLPTGSILPSEVAAGQTLTLSAGSTYTLSSALRVKENGVLTIEEGVTITAQGGTPTSMFIAIEQGGKIMAQGTAESPIVFTSAAAEPGSWGGILIAGKAPINTGTTSLGEIGDLLYGGTDVIDNSGILKYIRVEYTGSEINTEKQHNGITFYGVGAGTSVEYIEAYKGADDGIEFFGGTVNVKYVVVIGSQDDQFDFAEGWTGSATYVYLEQIDDPTYIQDKGIEGDNLKSDNEAAPFSNPTISNVTIIGYTTNKNEDGEATDGIRIREGAKGSFDNIVIKNYGDDGIDARSLVTLQNLVSGELSFTNIYVSGLGDKAIDAKLDDGETDPETVKADATTKLETGIVSDEPSGAEFSTWKGTWVKQ